MWLCHDVIVTQASPANASRICRLVKHLEHSVAQILASPNCLTSASRLMPPCASTQSRADCHPSVTPCRRRAASPGSTMCWRIQQETSLIRHACIFCWQVCTQSWGMSKRGTHLYHDGQIGAHVLQHKVIIAELAGMASWDTTRLMHIAGLADGACI